MPTRTTPEDGDIVVRQETRDGTVVYVLYTPPGPDESLLPTCEEAVAQAKTLAKRHPGRAWLTTDEGYDFVLLEDFQEWNRSDPTFVASTLEVIVMVKSMRRQTAHAVTTAAARSSKSLPNPSKQVTDRDIARRAYELFEIRGREHGHDLDDWLQAERELQHALSSNAA
jgi:DUF2934 family protein